MKKISTFLAGLLIAVSAFAANTAVLTWVAPTAYTDGTPITGAITYSIYQGVQGATKVKLGTTTTTLTSTISTGLNNGTTYCWTVTAAQAAGTESGPSNEACKTFPVVPLAPPTGLTAK